MGLVTTVGEERKRAKWYARTPRGAFLNFPVMRWKPVSETE